ncbi:uncharacterized protein LOC106175714 [Lingula anatina]|uniref:Uncharacterized protein LOC106175714 n=1 Tax=Lingula anatina TaxID=7574 RepID=A0A1S3JT55_LINAN|nr:uncharacterized protein LOC106175714 [Lingula anatina]|eukprot:XP_013413291.1 uncharacterized protein LOC106175714 [Lingula anatina]
MEEEEEFNNQPEKEISVTCLTPPFDTKYNHRVPEGGHLEESLVNERTEKRDPEEGDDDSSFSFEDKVNTRSVHDNQNDSEKIKDVRNRMGNECRDSMDGDYTADEDEDWEGDEDVHKQNDKDDNEFSQTAISNEQISAQDPVTQVQEEGCAANIPSNGSLYLNDSTDGACLSNHDMLLSNGDNEEFYMESESEQIIPRQQTEQFISQDRSEIISESSVENKEEKYETELSSCHDNQKKISTMQQNTEISTSGNFHSIHENHHDNQSQVSHENYHDNQSKPCPDERDDAWISGSEPAKSFDCSETLHEEYFELPDKSRGTKMTRIDQLASPERNGCSHDHHGSKLPNMELLKEKRKKRKARKQLLKQTEECPEICQQVDDVSEIRKNEDNLKLSAGGNEIENSKIPDANFACVTLPENDVNQSVTVITTTVSTVAIPPIAVTTSTATAITTTHNSAQPAAVIKEKIDVFAYLPSLRVRKPVDLPPEVLEDPLKDILLTIFDKADLNSNGSLNAAELEELLKSPTLDIDIKWDDVKKMTRSLDSKKEGNVTFEDFRPLAVEAMKVIYGRDQQVKSHWVELDLGEHTLYFNRVTGEASYIIPEDYVLDLHFADDLFADAVRAALARVDRRHTGQVGAKDFFTVLRSIAFSLRLTDEDLKEITKVFGSKRVRVSHEEFIPVAKQLICMIYRAREEGANDWCMMSSPRAGSFWFNKKTGQAKKTPPAHVIRAQQQQLEERTSLRDIVRLSPRGGGSVHAGVSGITSKWNINGRRTTSLTNTVQKIINKKREEEREKERQFLAAKLEELKEFTEKYEKEKKDREALETRHSNLQVKYEAACLELQKTQGLLEKLRTENKKKTEHIEGLQKEVTFMADRVKVLDQKALDLERAEITVEQLKRTLESYQKQNRDKESELKETRQCLEDTGKKLSVAHTQIEDLEEKASDLKQQVREELRRNEKLEQGLLGSYCTHKHYQKEWPEI